MPAIAPERVLKDLGELWKGLASPEAGVSTESGVLRACAMTFIVALEPEDDGQAVGQTIAELIHQHPSRAIVLKPGAEATPLDATVSAQCWMPFGKRQQVCCEQIEITAPPADAVQASRLILGLLAPDLPAVPEKPTNAQRVDAYIAKVRRLTSRKSFGRVDIWRDLNYSDATEFERWQRDDFRRRSRRAGDSG